MRKILLHKDMQTHKVTNFHAFYNQKPEILYAREDFVCKRRFLYNEHR